MLTVCLLFIGCTTTIVPKPVQDTEASWDGNVQNFGIIDGTALTDQNILDLYNAGVAALAGEGTGQRVGRVLDYIGWSSSDRTISSGNSILGAGMYPASTVRAATCAQPWWGKASSIAKNT